jgi:hypothetical protein
MPSTVIDLFNYDHRTATLRIVFRSGNVYAYKSVPEEIYVQFKQADSKGKYFNQAIRNHYTFEQLTR